MAEKALIAMSGGVDSSVAAAKMLQEGYECIGITMKLYDNEDIGIVDTKTCCSEKDVEDARRVCERLGIDFYVNNFKDDFEKLVMDKFAEAYSQGITPNPCINCNRYLKFDRLYKRAMELECDCIVTGHYVRVIHNEETGLYELHKGVDPKKDQSYVLFMLTQNQLAHTRFPIGEMCKEETRTIAEDRGFVNAAKHDSQDICFIPDGDYHRFLESHGVLCKPGNFVDSEGKVLGQHKGISNYTIGQRKGLGISGPSPYFVKEIRVDSNEVVLSDNDSLFMTTLVAEDCSYTVDNISDFANCVEDYYYDEANAKYSFKCLAKIRYRHNEAPASVEIYDDGRMEVVFDDPQRAITCGQAVVLYSGDRVLGGGTITKVL